MIRKSYYEDIDDDFKLKNPFGLHGLYEHYSACEGYPWATLPYQVWPSDYQSDLDNRCV